MKQRGITLPSSSQNVCIFCAHRLCGDVNLRPVRRSLLGQRRTFNTRNGSPQHLTTTTSGTDGDPSLQVYPSRSTPHESKGAKGWGSSFTRPSRTLNAQEEHLKETLQQKLPIARLHEADRSVKSSPPPHSRERSNGHPHASKGFKIHFHGAGSKGSAGDLTPHRQGFDRPHARSSGSRPSHAYKRVPIAKDEPAATGGTKEVGSQLEPSWRAKKASGESSDQETTPQWVHLRRKTSEGGMAESRERIVPAPREIRMEDFKDTRFVGFRKTNQPTESYPQAHQPEATTSYVTTSVDRDDQRTVGRPTGEVEVAAEAAETPVPTVVPEQEQEKRQEEDSNQQADRLATQLSADRIQGREKGKDRRRERYVREEDLDEGYDFVEDFEDGIGPAQSRKDLKKQKKAEKEARRAARQAAKQSAATPILLPEYVTVANLAASLKVKIGDLIARMEELGFEHVQYDHVLDAENSGLIAMEYNFEPSFEQYEAEDLAPRPPPEDPSAFPQRPPIVTIMGHVDHGKTTILDYLRKSSIAATEFGGITQHIGAFSVSMSTGKVITFLDTPGHAAFLNMRQRGANVTDIVILVVAADDSVKPQTIEAIKHAKAAGVPMIVAINKIDKEEANPQKVKQDLARHGVDVEDFGGDTQVVCVSGKTGQGIDDLEETVVTLSEILDMRAETDGPVEGWILEATTKKAGRVATVLVRRGTLHPGDIIVAGNTWARVRSLRNEAGIAVQEAGPGTPVEVDGWRDQPVAGDEVLQADDEHYAADVVELRQERQERKQIASDIEAINETRRLEQEKREREKAREEALAQGLADPTMKVDDGASKMQEVFFIIKGDVSGSVEAVVDSVAALGNAEVRSHILRSSVGPVSEFDVDHAAVAKGHIVAFNTTVDPKIRQMAEENGVRIIEHNIIYRLVDEVKATLSEKLAPIVTTRVLGEAEIAQMFNINIGGRKTMAIAGCKVRNGVINRGSKVRVLRGKELVYNGTLTSLKNVKKDVTEMRKGNECGMGFADWEGFQPGDQVQTYEEKVEKQSL